MVRFRSGVQRLLRLGTQPCALALRACDDYQCMCLAEYTLILGLRTASLPRHCRFVHRFLSARAKQADQKCLVLTLDDGNLKTAATNKVAASKGKLLSLEG